MVKHDVRQWARATPTQRSYAEARSRGWTVVPCEFWRRAGMRYVRTDLMGFADALFLPALLAVQITSDANHAARVKKIINDRHDIVWKWLDAGGRVSVWSWRRSKKTGRFVLREQPITADDLTDAGYIHD